jgi:GMP synthase (glutamine-hydrolysing)
MTTELPISDKVLIVDFGSQVTQLIARRVREAGVYCEIHPCHRIDAALIESFDPQAIILSGGPASVGEHAAPDVDGLVFECGLPVLGICYGQQIMCDKLGGRVEPSDHQEFGRAQVTIANECALFDGVWQPGEQHQVWMSHGDRVTALPEGFRVVATSDGAPFAAIADDGRKFYAVQFHPEVVHTPDGAKLLANFVHGVAGCGGDWTMAAFRDAEIARVREQVGAGKVICGLSGGVDSAVAAVLIHQAIGDQLTCIFVDHGLLRQDEAEDVDRVFRERFNIPLVTRDASELFLGKLAGVSDPEQKRKIIGGAFIDVFEYPDVIESVSSFGGPSATIKSHHNVGGLPERMNMKLVEPLRELFKDEVRDLGRELGIPEIIVGRHPFPGPGLAIRLPGGIEPDKIEILRKADAVYLDEIRKAGLYDEIWQAFAVLLPVRTVGVMGDARTYDYVCALRAVTSTDGMTADSYPFEHEFIAAVATRIINEVRGINRVVYDVTSKPPGTIEWE